MRQPAQRGSPACGPAPPSARSAFTLLELMLVLALLAMLAGLAWPSLSARISSGELPDSADELCSLLRMTRAAAMIDGHRHRVRFEPGGREPIVEFEAEPMIEPGRYRPVKADWATAERLRGDVNVVEVRPGRPEYTLPLVEEEPEDEAPATNSEDLSATTEEDVSAVIPPATEAPADADAPIDERRPVIVFEPDGSAEWATLVVARLALEGNLEEDTPQRWIEIDGRTGIAHLREPLTQARLADPSWRVLREQLRPPEVVFGSAEKSISVTAQQPGSKDSFGAGRRPDLGGESFRDSLSRGGADPFGGGDRMGGKGDATGRSSDPSARPDARRADGDDAARPSDAQTDPSRTKKDVDADSADPPPADDEPDDTTSPAPADASSNATPSDNPPPEDANTNATTDDPEEREDEDSDTNTNGG